ncbi:hypothetical protein ACNH6B_09325 [Shewanella basaltis]|uniref:hypothetical protein n=1 Tax=Shewanella basaltis TaxID=472183 RepID=UPI003AAB608B
MDGLVTESVNLLSFLELGKISDYEQLKPEDMARLFPEQWLTLTDDWNGLYYHAQQTAEGWYDHLLVARVLQNEASQAPNCDILAIKQLIVSRNTYEAYQDYPTLSQVLDTFYRNEDSFKRIFSAVADVNSSLIEEAESLLQSLLVTFSVQQPNIESLDWETYQQIAEAIKDNCELFFSSYFNHLNLAAELLIQLKPNCAVLKQVALCWPPYVLSSSSGELSFIRKLLAHCYKNEGVEFLLANVEHIMPEHLLFLVAQSSASDCIIMKKAFTDTFAAQGYYPGANCSLQVYDDFFTLIINRKSKRLINDHL